MAVVPTAGDRPRTLNHLVATAGMPVVIVHTRHGSEPHPDALNTTDLGPVNIHRWWNTGIRVAEQHGATVAVIVNDDVWPADADQLPALARTTDHANATIGYVNQTLTPVQTHRHPARVITGWCYALNLPHRLRPPEQFSWYFGDDWMCRQARVHHHGIIGVPIHVQHVKKGPEFPPHFEHMIREDRDRMIAYYRQWRHEQ